MMSTPGAASATSLPVTVAVALAGPLDFGRMQEAELPLGVTNGIRVRRRSGKKYCGYADDGEDRSPRRRRSSASSSP
jgi:hypothetical protein